MPKHIYHFRYCPQYNKDDQVDYIELQDNARVISAEKVGIEWHILIEETVDE